MLNLPIPSDTLTDAEQQFALWLAAHPRQTRAAQCAAYARFAGTPIDPVGLKALRTRREFFQFYKDARQTAAAQVARAQALALEMYPAGMRISRGGLFGEIARRCFVFASPRVA